MRAGRSAARCRARPLPDGAVGVTRCPWARSDLDIEYHDREWGVPVHDDRLLFELITLEGAQAGLSWSTILKKRGGYRAAFADFDPRRVSRFTERDIERLVGDPSIVRHRQKIASTVGNARAFLEVQHEFGSFDSYLWRAVGGRPMVNSPRTSGDLPTRTSESDALSKDLVKRGFKFVGTTICYAYMQATGLVDDHLTTCFRHGAGQRAAHPRP